MTVIETITFEKLKAWQASGKTLEADERGIKVSLMPDGTILKLFRVRRWLSSELFSPKAWRFCDNAELLKQRNIATVHILQQCIVKNCDLKTVKYAPLAGETVRNLLKNQQIPDEAYPALGEFIAELHQKGIYFRSLHLGNIIYHVGQFGLIDIADMRFWPWPLHLHTRLRNFERLYGYQEDLNLISAENLSQLRQAYLAKTQYDDKVKAKIAEKLSQKSLFK